jgi:ABC transport system ATP-binding/permease protein
MSDQIFIMEGNGEVTVYNGNYSEYRLSLDTPKEKPADKSSKTSSTSTATSMTIKKLSYKEQKELEESENKIAELERLIASLTTEIGQVDGNDYVRINELGVQIGQRKEELEVVSLRWLELSELSS